MVFEKKKIQLETLGEYLLEARGHLKFSLAEVSQRTGVKIAFLEALERGDFKKLPAQVYVYGFLRQLAGLYKSDGQALIDQYKKELAIQDRLVADAVRSQSWVKRNLGRINITPKLISFAAGILFLFFTVVYVIWQVGSINKVPNLELYQPKDRQVVFGSSVEVKGKTDPGMNLQVNGQDVFVDSAGNFQIQLSLEAGPKDLTVVSKNKFDKTATIKISVVGQPEVTIAAKLAELKLEFSGDGLLEYSVDDGLASALDFHAGDSKIFFGQNKILISTSNAGATAATFNGQRLGPLGRIGERLTAIPFFARADNSTSSTSTKP